MNYSVFDTLLDSVLVVDRDRRITYFNESCATLLELPRRKIRIGSPCFEIVKFEESDLFCMPDGSWGRDEPSPYREVNFVSLSGREGRVQISIQPASPDAWLVFMRDVSLEQALHLKYRTELQKKEKALADLRKAHEALEDYSKNLEKKVEDRTAEIGAINQLLRALLDSLGQAFLVFDREGGCLPVYSRACEPILEAVPDGKPVWEVLRIPSGEVPSVQAWISALFEEKIPFSDLLELGPAEYSHSERKHITLEYHSMRGEGGRVQGVVLVATDRTREREAELQAQKERAYVQMVVRIVKNKIQFLSFVNGALEMISRLERGQADIPEALRVLHTIKGGAGTFSLQELQDHAHELESQLAESAGSHSRPLPVLPQEALAGCQSIAQELRAFFARNRDIIGRDLNDLERRQEIPLARLLDFLRELRGLPRGESLQAKFIEVFLKQPVRSSFSHMDDLLLELAQAQGKRIKPVAVIGGDLRVGIDQYAELFSSLDHVFRNVVEHALESPDERRQSGKEEEGALILGFSRESRDGAGYLSIKILDDGRGIDPEAIRKKLRLKDEDPAFEEETDDQVIQRIFDSGFSTCDEVTRLSGRGIGMDVVASAVRGLGGSVRVSSQIGVGTRIDILVPDIYLLSC